MQRGTSRQEQKAEEERRRIAALLQFQDDRDSRRLKDEQTQVTQQLAAQVLAQLPLQTASARLCTCCMHSLLPSSTACQMGVCAAMS